MKKFLSVIAAVSVALALGACGQPKQEESQNPQENKTENTKVYKISSDNSFAPFEFLDTETNKYIGVDMDILAAIAEDQGFKYEVKNEGFDAAMGSVQSGQADAMIAGMTINDERRKDCRGIAGNAAVPRQLTNGTATTSASTHLLELFR